MLINVIKRIRLPFTTNIPTQVNNDYEQGNHTWDNEVPHYCCTRYRCNQTMNIIANIHQYDESLGVQWRNLYTKEIKQ